MTMLGVNKRAVRSQRKRQKITTTERGAATRQAPAQMPHAAQRSGNTEAFLPLLLGENIGDHCIPCRTTNVG